MLSIMATFFSFFFFPLQNQIVTVVLENYGGFDKTSDALTHENEDTQVKKDSTPPDGMSRISSWKRIVNEKGEVVASM